MTAGRICSSCTAWSTNRLPNATRKPTANTPVAAMTSPVATDRRIRVASLATAGSMASERNQAITRVKMTEPPSASTNLASRSRATRPARVTPTRHMFAGTSTALTVCMGCPTVSLDPGFSPSTIGHLHVSTWPECRSARGSGGYRKRHWHAFQLAGGGRGTATLGADAEGGEQDEEVGHTREQRVKRGHRSPPAERLDHRT